MEESLERWRHALERRGMKVHRSKTENLFEREGPVDQLGYREQR